MLAEISNGKVYFVHDGKLKYSFYTFLSKTFESIDQEIHLIYFFRKWIGRYQ